MVVRNKDSGIKYKWKKILLGVTVLNDAPTWPGNAIGDYGVYHFRKIFEFADNPGSFVVQKTIPYFIGGLLFQQCRGCVAKMLFKSIREM